MMDWNQGDRKKASEDLAQCAKVAELRKTALMRIKSAVQPHVAPEKLLGHIARRVSQIADEALGDPE